MSTTIARLLRVATVAVFVAVAYLAFRTFTPEPQDRVDEPRAGELNVASAINGPDTGVVIVRGHVFDGPGGHGLRLCEGIRESSPPMCLGPFLDLDGVNAGNFSFRTGKTQAGEVRWVEEPLALRGTIVGTRMVVSEVLR